MKNNSITEDFFKQIRNKYGSVESRLNNCINIRDNLKKLHKNTDYYDSKIKRYRRILGKNVQ